MRSKESILDGMNIVDFLMRCKIDFKFFCERVLGITEDGGIHPFQMEWFYLIQNNDRVCIQAPSGFSKTTIFIAYSIWLAWNYRNKNILIISKSMPQSRRILGIIKDYIEDNELLLELKPKDFQNTWSSNDLKTTSKCRIYCRPYSINIKGERVDFMLLDEADSYEDTTIFFDHLISRMNPGGKIALISTPEGPTRLLGQIKSRDKGDYVFKTYVAIVDEFGNPKKEPYEEGFSIWPERFPIEDLMERRRLQGEQFFQKNYMCNILTESEDTIFSMKSILNCYNEDYKFNEDIDPEAQYFIGADFAISKGPRADYDAFVVIEKKDDKYIIKNIEIHKGWPRPKKIDRLKELYNTYSSNRQTKIIADESNIGTIFINDLKILGCTVIAQNFHSIARKQLIQTLANVIEGEALIIPRNKNDLNAIKLTDELTRQLLGFKRKKMEETSSERLLSKHSHDDIAMSLAMAIKGAIKQKSNKVSVAMSN